MKRSKEDAKRWLEQAEYDFKVANNNFNSKFYSYVCFMCEQTAQKALKAFLIYKGERYVWEHSIQELARKASKYESKFGKLIDTGMILDKFYIPTRYPDALAPPAVPYKSYRKEDALEAIKLTEKIIRAVKKELVK